MKVGDWVLVAKENNPYEGQITEFVDLEIWEDGFTLMTVKIKDTKGVESVVDVRDLIIIPLGGA